MPGQRVEQQKRNEGRVLKSCRPVAGLNVDADTRK